MSLSCSGTCISMCVICGPKFNMHTSRSTQSLFTIPSLEPSAGAVLTCWWNKSIRLMYKAFYRMSEQAFLNSVLMQLPYSVQSWETHNITICLEVNRQIWCIFRADWNQSYDAELTVSQQLFYTCEYRSIYHQTTSYVNPQERFMLSVWLNHIFLSLSF